VIEVLKQMVEALEWSHGGEPVGTADAIQAGKKLIAELESQEPVAWALEWTFDGEEKGRRLYDDEWQCIFDAENDGGVCRSLVYGNTAPSQRTWVGLTDVEIDYLLGSTIGENEETHISFARAIEAKLKELNDHGI
jgi:hypothetical protein